MPAVVSEVLENSIAQELEIEKGDKIISINNEKPQDMIDYRYMMCSEEIELEIEKTNGETEIYEIEKDFDEDLGVVFESAVFDRIKPCTNRCIFCFVDQQPEGLRKSLYIKDDDYRLSYLQGTYVTLTNLTQKDRERIEKLHLGPLYVSVHTTNPELRVKMLSNPRAANIIEDLKWLKKADIPIHAQIVLCPGYNDGQELERTLSDFAKFKSIIESVAIVPVGITKFHQNGLKTLTKSNALHVIKQVEEFNKKVKKQLAMASDEFFLKADYPVPEKKYYGNFAQIEDGVGALRLLMDDFEKNRKKIPLSVKKPKEIIFATTPSAAKLVGCIADELNKVKNLQCSVIELKNNFFGDNVIVAGLITGNDLICQLKEKSKELNIQNVIIPSIMLRPFTEDFLDNVTLKEVEQALECKVFPIKDIYSAREIIDIIKS
ncbi:MAG TPA: DUF512 domain-containing protein [Candidatus Limenecus avicola]|jgi:hypothetical protein|uniref:DUF512 domain-containing protein n=1 Tax=Candidatus Limenecus avicola TaxID=2840847 RepID=A0A9D1N209_9CLOT|nr:DUF512 domain-containing protein [Candidatus Limenecus avicola]